MPKIYNDPDIQDRKMNENIWFQINQPLLLWLANTDYGRDFLHIDKSYPEIIEISKRHVKYQIEPGLFVSVFSPRARKAAIIRSEWEEYKQIEKWYYNRFDITKHIDLYPKQSLIPFTKPTEIISCSNFYKQLKLVATTTTVYPDADPETTSVDGSCMRDTVDEVWADIRGGAGNNSVDDSTNLYNVRLRCSVTLNQYANLARGFALFDTSSIPDTDTISAATCSFYGQSTASTPNLASGNAQIALVNVTPAANNDLVNADFSQSGTTQQATNFAFASWATGSYNVYTLNATGIASVSKTGVTKFGTRFEVDRANGTPEWNALNAADHQLSYARETGDSTAPKLVVTHAASTGHINMLLMGVG